MPKICDENKTRLSALAQLIQKYAEFENITKTSELAKLTQYSERAIWKAKTELECSEKECTVNSSSVNPSAETLHSSSGLRTRVQCEPRAPARIENPSGLNNIINTPPFPPKGKIEVSEGVISHPGFQISLDAIELDTFGSIPMETIRRVCESEAMQWALEIDAGKLPMDVLPNKIRPYLSAQVRKAHDRANQQQPTKEKGGVYALLESEGYFQ